MPSELIITAASRSYSAHLLSLVGSANANWPGHPPILAYDLGMTEETVALLTKAGVEVRRVPEFCPHWRKYYIWKIWCCCDAPADRYLWLDAGIYVLRPLPEAFVALDRLGYYVQPNGFSLGDTACQPLQHYFSDLKFDEVPVINGGLHGFDKTRAAPLLDEAYRLCVEEKYVAPDSPLGRGDQDLLSALVHRHFAPVVYLDRHLYAEHAGPEQVHGQRIWVHRREMRSDDADYFRNCVLTPSAPRLPSRAPRSRRSLIRELRVLVAKWRGRFPDESQALCIGVRD